MAPMLTLFAQGWFCTASPFCGREAVLREVPASPPQRGEASLGAALREAC